MWREIRCNLIHEEKQFQFTICRLLCQHPIVQFTRQFLNEILLLCLILNGVQVNDVQWNLSGNGWFNKGINVNWNTIGKEELIDAARKGCESPSQIIASCFWQPFFKICKPMFEHDLVPTWNIGFLSLIVLNETVRIEESREFMMWFPNHASE